MFVRPPHLPNIFAFQNHCPLSKYHSSERSERGKIYTCFSRSDISSEMYYGPKRYLGYMYLVISFAFPTIFIPASAASDEKK